MFFTLYHVRSICWLNIQLCAKVKPNYHITVLLQYYNGVPCYSLKIHGDDMKVETFSEFVNMWPFVSFNGGFELSFISQIVHVMFTSRLLQFSGHLTFQKLARSRSTSLKIVCALVVSKGFKVRWARFEAPIFELNNILQFPLACKASRLCYGHSIVIGNFQ